MAYIRRLVFLILQGLSTIILFPVILVAIFLPSVKKAQWISIWARTNIGLAKWMLGLDYRVSGAIHIPSEPCIIVSNHQSSFETLAFQEIFPAQSYILKQELFFIPLFGWGLAANEPIAINRSMKHRALNIITRESRIRIHRGRFVVIYPEGTRQPYGNPAKFQVGAAVIAKKLGIKLLPVAHNCGKFWPKSTFLVKPGVVDFVVGEPIDAADMNTRELSELIEARIKTMMETL